MQFRLIKKMRKQIVDLLTVFEYVNAMLRKFECTTRNCLFKFSFKFNRLAITLADPFNFIHLLNGHGGHGGHMSLIEVEYSLFSSF